MSLLWSGSVLWSELSGKFSGHVLGTLVSKLMLLKNSQFQLSTA